MIERKARKSIISKSEITPAFQAAKAAGWDQVSVTVETVDGRKISITAGSSGEVSTKAASALDAWRSGRAS